MLQEILTKGRSLEASDIHLAAGHRVAMRIDGLLSFIPSKELTEENMLQICRELLGLQASSHFQLKNELDFAYSDAEGRRYRVNLYLEQGKLAAAIRLLRESIPSCQELELPAPAQAFLEKERGMIIISGPTGSGKSTTLAAMVDLLNREKRLHIITLEDPVEYIHSSKGCLIHQRNIGEDTLNLLTGIKNALREDPDVLLIGELRDAEVMKHALQAAETGHLVLTSLHTQGAVATITRILDALPPVQAYRAQLAESLIGVISQKLVVNKNGHGRRALFEILVMNNAVRSLIRDGKLNQIQSYLETGEREGMQTFEKAERMQK